LRVQRRDRPRPLPRGGAGDARAVVPDPVAQPLERQPAAGRTAARRLTPAAGHRRRYAVGDGPPGASVTTPPSPASSDPLPVGVDHVLDALKCAIVATDLEGRVIAWNRAAE